ncbi:MAG: AtpZ/AtpI family protein [Alphaproteobacteria bacterium]|nr:AtpZ/AtpI family protein [Alphaproteobacteria bacterium]
MTEPEDPYVETVRRKAERMARARQDRTSVWVVLARAGSLAWQFVLLLVGCTLLGRLVGRALASDVPTLVGLATGLALGLWQASRTLRQSLEDE